MIQHMDEAEKTQWEAYSFLLSKGYVGDRTIHLSGRNLALHDLQDSGVLLEVVLAEYCSQGGQKQ